MKMKIEKRQTIMEGEIKVLKDTVWRLTTRVYGLEEQIKEMKSKLKMTTAVDSRLVYSQQILASNSASSATYVNNGRGSRTKAATTPSSSSRSSPRVKERNRKSQKTVKFEDVSPKKRNQGVTGPKGKLRQIAVKKTGGGASSGSSTGSGKTPRRLEHQSVITKRGRRATSFKLQPSDEEKEVYFVSDSSDDGESKNSKSAEKPRTPQKSPPQKSSDSAADDFMKVLNETPSGDYSTIEAHEDLIVFPSTSELNIGNEGNTSVGSVVGHEESDQLPIKKRRLDCGGFEDDLFTREERISENELAESVMEGVASYIHTPPDSFSCFFCGQQFPTDEERAVHSKIHAGAPKKSF